MTYTDEQREQVYRSLPGTISQEHPDEFSDEAYDILADEILRLREHNTSRDMQAAAWRVVFNRLVELDPTPKVVWFESGLERAMRIINWLAASRGASGDEPPASRGVQDDAKYYAPPIYRCGHCGRIYNDLSDEEMKTFVDYCPSDDCPGRE